jgi:phosphoserine phosphatase
MGRLRYTVQDVVDRCGRLAEEGRRLRPGRSFLAAFDADGTLWGPDVAEILWARLIGRKALDRGAAGPIARVLRSLGREPTLDPYEDYASIDSLHRSGRCPEVTLTRVMLQGLSGIAEDDLYRHALEAIAEMDEFQPGRLASSGRMLAAFREQGYRIVVVSASPRWVVEVALGRLGAESQDIIAGEVAVFNGRLTDQIIEPHPHGKGKVQAILRRHGTVPRVSLGNALADLPMLEATSHLRVLVNPTEELLHACDGIGGNTWSIGLPGTGPAAQASSGVRPTGRVSSSGS